MTPRSLSLRSFLVLVVLAGAVLPLGLAGIWLARSGARAGEEALRSRMREGLEGVTDQVGERWVRIRGQLLDLGETGAVQEALKEARRLDPQALPAEVVRALERLEEGVAALEVRGADGQVVLSVRDESLEEGPQESPGRFGAPGGPTLPVALEIFDPSGRLLGKMEASVRVSRILPLGSSGLAETGSVLAAFDARNGRSLLPLPFHPELLQGTGFTRAGERWTVLRRPVAEPSMRLVLAAPVDPFLTPFLETGRRSAAAVAVVAVLALVLTLLFSAPLAGALESTARAADRVARGHLDGSVPERGSRETRRLAWAFNTMTGSLRRTLDRLARQEGLAKVGEFASALAHEVRNPLTSIRVDLQRVQEKVSADAGARRALDRALREVGRLETTVSGTLRVARSGRIRRSPVPLTRPLEAALEVAGPTFREEKVHLERVGSFPPELTVEGDADALEQLYLNLLLNAAQVSPEGGVVRVSVAETAEEAVVRIRDQGPGVDPDEVEALFEPFHSGRKDGTGLGLAVVRQVAEAHGGSVELTTAADGGAVVEVLLPRPDPARGAP